MANPIFCSTLQQLIYLGVAPSTILTYKSGVTSFLNFCASYNIPPYLTSPLTLQFFCAHLVTNVFYKIIKVYLAGIHFAHPERGHSDPTDNEPLRLSYGMIVLYSRDQKGVSLAHETTSPKNQPRLPLTIMRQHWLGKTKPKQTFKSTRNAFNKLLWN